VPERFDLAPRLVARTGAPIESVDGWWTQKQRLQHRLLLIGILPAGIRPAAGPAPTARTALRRPYVSRSGVSLRQVLREVYSIDPLYITQSPVAALNLVISSMSPASCRLSCSRCRSSVAPVHCQVTASCSSSSALSRRSSAAASRRRTSGEIARGGGSAI